MVSKETIIKNIPVGKANAIKVADLEQKIGNEATGTNNDSTRSEIRDIIKEAKVPIGSCKTGVYIPKDKVELDELIAKNKKMAKGYLDKAKNLEKAYETYTTKK